MEARWEIKLMGGLRVQRGSQARAHFRTRKTASLLAYLAFHPGMHARESLIEVLWPDIDPLAGRNRLRVTLSLLRDIFEEDAVVVADRSSAGLDATFFTTDVAKFEAALARGKRCSSRPERKKHLIQTLDYYGGGLAPGLFESWIPPAEACLEEALVGVVRMLMADLEADDEHQQAIEYGLRGLSLAPLREELHSDVMRLHAALGHPASALRQYHELTRLLREHLQTEPCTATRELHARLEAHDK